MPEPTKTPRKITLEELLRLKRHERPGSEFWVRFDRELNARVWRALVEPVPTTGWWSAIFGRRARWLAIGLASASAVVFSIWPGQPTMTPMAAFLPAHLAAATSPAVSSPTVTPEKEPARVAMVLPVLHETDTPPVGARLQYAVAAIENSPSPANYNKVPATVAFAAAASHGVHFAADTLQSAQYTTRDRGSAY